MDSNKEGDSSSQGGPSEGREPGIIMKWLLGHKVIDFLIAVAAGLLVFYLTSGGGPERSTIGPPTTTTPVTSTTEPLQPEPNVNDLCSSLLSSVISQRATLVDSPGQLEGGPFLRGKSSSGGGWSILVRVKAGSNLALSIELFDGAYGSVSDVVASVPLPSGSADCWKITATVKWQNDESSLNSLTSDPVFIEGPRSSKLHLEYLSGSTVLYDSKGKEITPLSNGVSNSGVFLPYIVAPAGPSGNGIQFINFNLKVSVAMRKYPLVAS